MSLKYRDTEIFINDESLIVQEFYLSELSFLMMRCYNNNTKMFTTYNLGTFDSKQNLFVDLINEVYAKQKLTTIKSYLDSAPWNFAKTMSSIPHFWTLKKDWKNEKHFIEFIEFMDANYVIESFMNKDYKYTYVGDYKYWYMDSDSSKVILINRAKI
jgi:hypothetical protein